MKLSLQIIQGTTFVPYRIENIGQLKGRQHNLIPLKVSVIFTSHLKSVIIF